MRGLAPFFEERRYLNGQTIFRRDEAAQSIFFIVTGIFDLTDAMGDIIHHINARYPLGFQEIYSLTLLLTKDRY